jgi:hypothetical protein
VAAGVKMFRAAESMLGHENTIMADTGRQNGKEEGRRRKEVETACMGWDSWESKKVCI